jgi:circadian clock protein KaiB
MNRPRKPSFKFCLYVADHTENSEAARANLAAICARYLPDQCEIEVVDVLRDPSRAAEASVMMTPTLVKLLPLPERRFVGTLHRTEAVLTTLGIKEIA